MNLTIHDLIADVMLNAIASGLMVSTCSIQAPSGTFDSGGAPTGPYAPVAGLQDLQCMSAPLSTPKVSAGEVKTDMEIRSKQNRHVLLAGYYPAIPASNDNWQAIIDGVVYDIVGSESDSQSTQTRLEVRVAQI